MMTYIEMKTAKRSRWVRWLWGLDIEIEKIEASKPRRPLDWVEGG